MFLGLRRTAAWIAAASTLSACGSEFTASDARDADSEGSAGAGNTQGSGAGGASSGAGGASSGAGGASGAGGSRAGSGGTAGGQGGTLGSAGVSGRGGTGGTAGSSGRGGAGGTVGASGRGGTGGTSGTAGRGGAGGSAGASGSTGASGSPGDASVDSSTCQPQGTVDARCSDNSCSRLAWTFDSGSLDGITSQNLPLAVRTFNGSAALAVDVAQLNAGEISFSLSICQSGNIDLGTKTFSFRVYFDGMPASSGELYVGASLPDVATGFISDIAPNTGVWISYSEPLGKSSRSSTATKITIRAGSTGVAFGGTIWFDDFRIQ
jgi:hypothetical protein